MKKIIITLLLFTFSHFVFADETLYMGRNLFEGKHICEILPINEKVVKVVLFNERNKILDTYYFTKGQTFYSSYSEILREKEITFDRCYGKSEYSSKIIVVSFNYNQITIKKEPIEDNK